MNDYEVAWAAGLFDGEGCACLCRQIRRVRRGEMLNPPRVYYSPSASVVNTDYALLERFQHAVGDGKIRRMPLPAKPQHNQRWMWEVTGTRNVATVYAVLAPYLSPAKTAAFTKTLAGREPHDA